MTMTTDQINAVLEAQTERPELADMEPEAVGDMLRADAHPAFAPVTEPAPTELALAPAGEKQLPAVQGGYVPEGLEELGEGDLKTPELKIDHDAEEWVSSIDDEQRAKTVELVVLAIRPYHAWWAAHEKSHEAVQLAVIDRAKELGLKVEHDHKGILCQSPDRKIPLAQDHGVVSSKCKGCPANKWRKTSTGKSTKDCSEGYLLVCMDLTDGRFEPVMVRIKGSALRPWKKTQTLLMAFGRRQKVGAYGFRLAATVERAPAKGGEKATHCLPDFSAPEFVGEGELLDALAEAYQAYGKATS